MTLTEKIVPNKLSGKRLLPFGILSIALCAPAAHATLISGNFIQVSGFETPAVGPGGYGTGFQTYNVGTVLAGVWTVVGTGNVSIYPSSETVGTGHTALNVPEGVQALDLTGILDNGAATGVRQTLATTVGQNYTLSFYVGELWAPASVTVNMNGALFQVANNNLALNGDTTVWKQFMYDFTATSASTTLDFMNNAANGTVLNALDAVVVTTALPEPSTFVMLGGSVLLFSAFRRFRRARN